MSAAAVQPTTELLPRRLSPALSLLPVPELPAPGSVPLPVRPRLEVIEGGRSPAYRARRSSYLRRRLAVGAVLATVAVALVLLVGAISTRFAGGDDPSSTAGAPSPTPAAAVSAAGVAAPAGSRIVQPGDTLWSIAAELAPGEDLRPVVDRLVELNGADPLVVGARVYLR